MRFGSGKSPGLLVATVPLQAAPRAIGRREALACPRVNPPAAAYFQGDLADADGSPVRIDSSRLTWISPGVYSCCRKNPMFLKTAPLRAVASKRFVPVSGQRPQSIPRRQNLSPVSSCWGRFGTTPWHQGAFNRSFVSVELGVGGGRTPGLHCFYTGLSSFYLMPRRLRAFEYLAALARCSR